MVAPLIIAAGIGAAGSIAGGLMGSNATQKANAANIKYQKEFAQKGIQWRVADAKAAGVHPLYALGAQTHSFAPNLIADTSMADAVSNAGQDISRAVAGMSSTSEFQEAAQQLALTRGALENELLASQIRLVNQPGSPPRPNTNPFIDGEADSIITGPHGEKLAIVSRPGAAPFVVRNPEIAQTMQGHYGEGIGDIAGAEAYVIDQATQPYVRRNSQGDYIVTGGGF